MSEPSAAGGPIGIRGVKLSDAAVSRLKHLQSEHSEAGAGLRVAIKGGGCSGLSYVIDWVSHPKEKDKTFEREGARLYVDSKSLLYISGSELHYEESLMSAGFKLRNPNAKSACSCGESFSV